MKKQADRYDMDPDPGDGIDTAERNSELDADLLKGGESIAGILLRPITAGDLAILMQSGVGIVLGRTDNLTYDTGAILFTQSQPKEIVREAFRDGTLRDKVLDFLDEYDPTLFGEAVPRVADLVGRMNRSRTAISGSAPSSGDRPKKAGRRAG
jgi:hypothetical protein